MTQMLKIILFFIFMFVGGLNAFSGEYTKENELKAEYGQISIRVLLTALTKFQPCRAALSWGWGVEDACPETIIEALEIKVRGNSVFVPLSAFADLGNPSLVSIEPREGKDSFAVILTGGDAGTSYSSTLEFRNNIIRERVVRHGEFPEDAWEKTIYKFNMQEK